MDEWEELDVDELERTKVEGGWIYRSIVERGTEDTCSVSVALCFVPEA